MESHSSCHIIHFFRYRLKKSLSSISKNFRIQQKFTFLIQIGQSLTNFSVCHIIICFFYVGKGKIDHRILSLHLLKLLTLPYAKPLKQILSSLIPDPVNLQGPSSPKILIFIPHEAVAAVWNPAPPPYRGPASPCLHPENSEASG